QAVQVAEDKLDGLHQAAGSFTLPNLAEATASHRLQQAIAGNRLGVALLGKAHPGGSLVGRSAACSGRSSGRERGTPGGPVTAYFRIPASSKPGRGASGWRTGQRI